MKTPVNPTITLRRTTAVPKKRAELEEMLTRSGVERFLKELGKGALEAEIAPAYTEVGSEGADMSAFDSGAAGATADEKLAVGDTVTVRLAQLEFSGIAGLAQMVAAAKAPAKFKPMVEGTSLFGKIGASLDVAYAFLRNGLQFKSKITEWTSGDEALVYVDEGQELPRPIKSWKHTHRFAEQGEGGLIVDELTVEVDPAVAAPVIEGALRLHLESRAKAYKKIFAN